jgi:serine O-acetyltransferase
VIDALKKDMERYRTLGGWYRHPGFWVGAVYRFGAWAHGLPPILRLLMVTAYRVLKLPWRMFRNVSIAAHARIGPGLCLIHPNNILIPAGVEIGEGCLVFHEVTFGTGPVAGLPKLGDHVDVYVGARVLGGITVGDRSMIGANCVVTRSVPPASVVMLPPPRVLARSLLERAPPEQLRAVVSGPEAAHVGGISGEAPADPGAAAPVPAPPAPGGAANGSR